MRTMGTIRRVGGALAVTALLTSAPTIAAGAHPVRQATAWCGWNSVEPDRWGYTFERGATSGLLPGHAFVGWRNPLPNGAQVQGGPYQYWKNEDGYSLFLVNRPWWWYHLAFYVTCLAGSG